MKIKLEDIETLANQERYLKAEELLDQQLLMDLREVEFNLWTAWFKNESNDFEIEVQLRGTTVMNSTCDCQEHSKKNYCAHVLAALLAIRKVKTKPVDLPDEQKAVTERSERVYEADFIEELSTEDLFRFVKQYAKRDKRFMLALKVHFATQVESLQDEQAYQNILETTQRSTRRMGKRFSFQSQRDYLKVIDKLIAQNKLAYQNQDWRGSYDLTFALLKNLFFNLPFTDKAKRPFLDRCRRVLVFADDLAALPLAPEMEEDFLHFFLEHIQKDGLAFKYLGPALISCARKKSAKAEAQLELLEILETLRKDMEILHPHWGEISEYCLDLASHLGIDVLQGIHEPMTIHQDIYLSTLARLENQFAFKPLKTLTAFSRDIHPANAFLAALDEFDLSMAIRENDPQRITALARIRLFESGKVSYYQLLKKANGEIDWINLKAEIMDALEAHSQTPKIQDLMGEIYRLEKKPQELLKYAQENMSMAVMREHAQWLFDRKPAELRVCYPEIILAYTNQHVGPVAAEQVNLGLQEIQQLFGDELVTQLIQQLKEQHPNRHALLGSIESIKV